MKKPKRKPRSITRTRDLLLAALRVWELKQNHRYHRVAHQVATLQLDKPL